MGTNILRNRVGFSAYDRRTPPAVLLPDFNSTVFAGIFQGVQMRDVLRFSIFNTYIDTFTPSSSANRPFTTEGPFQLEDISCQQYDAWIIFSSEFCHIPAQFPFASRIIFIQLLSTTAQIYVVPRLRMSLQERATPWSRSN
jgi:hypothetical protein